MKKIILFLLFSITVFSQNSGKIAQKIQDFQKLNVVFEKQTLFLSNASIENDFQKIVDNATLVDLDLNKINSIVAQKKQYLEVEIPYNGTTISVLLYKVEIHTENFQVDTDKQKNIAFEKGLFYRGIVKNDFNSLVSFNFFNNQMSAIISNSEFGNLVVGKLETSNNIKNYIIYEDSKLKIPNNFVCASQDDDVKTIVNAEESVNSNRCVTIYFEMDNSLFVANGSTTAQATIWMNSIFNNVQTLFTNDGISIAMKSLFIWTTPDPYTGTTSLQNLNTFHAVRPVFNGDIGHLLGIDGGFGGLARSTNGLCNIYNYSYSDLDFVFQTVPVYSWPVNVISHELGHLLGSPHTHGCFWNGNNTAIDGCGPTVNAIYAEGNCPTAPLPTVAQKGTIMSYCFLIPSIGINFANGFGPQPAARMIQNINNSACLSTDCINTCISQINNLVVTPSTLINDPTISVSFTDANILNTQWQYAVTSYPFVANTWITVSSTTFVIQNLNTASHYKIYVRPICPQNITFVPKEAFILTNSNFCNNVTFTDTGGLNNNYQDNESWTRTILPANNASIVTVNFLGGTLEQDYDFLYIYSGLSTSSPLLTPNGITGVISQSNFTANNPSGALTFKFVSDGNTTTSGWNATLGCYTLGIDNQDFIDFSYYPNPVKNEIEINSKNEIQNIAIYSIDGKLLFSDDKKFFKGTFSMQDYAKGNYLFKLTFDNKSVSFKIVKE